MNRYRLQLYSYIMQALYKKNVLIYNRGGEINEINKSKYTLRSRDYGDALIYDDNYYIHMSYHFFKEVKGLEDRGTVTFNSLNTEYNNYIGFAKILDTISKSFGDLYLTKKNNDLLDLSYKIERYYNKDILEKFGLYVIDMPRSIDEVRKEAEIRVKEQGVTLLYGEQLHDESLRIDPNYDPVANHNLEKLMWVLNEKYKVIDKRDFTDIIYDKGDILISDTLIDNNLLSE